MRRFDPDFDFFDLATGFVVPTTKLVATRTNYVVATTWLVAARTKLVAARTNYVVATTWLVAERTKLVAKRTKLVAGTTSHVAGRTKLVATRTKSSFASTAPRSRPAKARDDFEILSDLLRALGAEAPQTLEGVFKEISAAIPAFEGLTLAKLGDGGIPLESAAVIVG